MSQSGAPATAGEAPRVTARVALFAGGLRSLPQSGRPTGMYKQALNGAVDIGSLGLAGDVQADLRVHGGPDKAVHLYPAAHYRRLAARFPDAAALLQPGSIGENLSTPDLDEDDVRVGEVWQLGSALLQVCQPRTPCWKIDERFASDGMAAYIAETLLTGWYWRVLEPGRVEPGQQLERRQSDVAAPTLGEAQRLCQAHRPPLESLSRLAAVPGIAPRWRDKITQRLRYLATLSD